MTDNDGATILSRLKEPFWNDQTWVENLIQIELEHQVIMSDEQLKFVRDFMKKSPWLKTGKYKQALACVAWHRGEHNNVIQTMNPKNTDFSQYPEGYLQMYTASLILSGQTATHMFENIHEMDETKQEDLSLFWFAKSLVLYMQKQHSAAVEAVSQCSAALIKQIGHIPPYEESIFTSIKDKKLEASI